MIAQIVYKACLKRTVSMIAVVFLVIGIPCAVRYHIDKREHFVRRMDEIFKRKAKFNQEQYQQMLFEVKSWGNLK